MKKVIKSIVSIILIVTLLMTTGCSIIKTNNDETETSVSTRTEDGYTLDSIFILSRHNIRSPLSDEGSTLASVTTYDWFDWTSGKSELSLRGGVLETEFGQYFRKYLVSEGLIEENWNPTEDECRIYANSMQRTIATANYFKSGFVPTSNIETEYHCEINTMDPVFHPKFTFLSEAFKEQALNEIAELGGENGIAGITENLSENYTLLEKVLNFKNSTYAEENCLVKFDTDAPEIKFEMGEEPYLEGTLDLTASIADALVLQYYEENGSDEASFGTKLSAEEWKQIALISDMYEETIFGTHSIAVNVANPMLKEIRSELTNEDRKVSYLCGHDSNVITVLTALGVEDYELPGSISKDTPIGCKLVIQKWINEDGESFITVDMMYQSVEQLQNCEMLDMDNPPMIYNLSFEGIEKNEDGYYDYDEFMNKLDFAIEEYNNLPTD